MLHYEPTAIFSNRSQHLFLCRENKILLSLQNFYVSPSPYVSLLAHISYLQKTKSVLEIVFISFSFLFTLYWSFHSTSIHSSKDKILSLSFYSNLKNMLLNDKKSSLTFFRNSQCVKEESTLSLK